MSFLNSIMFWGVMAGIGVAIPVFIHLFSRYRSRPMDWAAMELLRRAMVVRARRMRLEDMILLALRILAGVLVAMALARPTLMHTNLSLGGGGADVAVVVALDGSYSMGHQPGVQSRFDLARKRTEDIFKTLSPGDPVTLVLMGDQPRILLRNVAYDPEQMAKVLKRLEPLSEGLNLDAATDELKRLVAEMKAATTELYLVTDAQAVTWKDLSTATRKALVNLGETSNVYLVPVGPEKAEDIAITRLVVASGTQRKGSVVRYLAEVRNAGWRPVDNVVVRLHVDGMAVDQQTVSLGFRVPVPGAVHRIELEQMSRSGGIGGDLIDTHDVEFRLVPTGAQAEPSHAAEAVDADTDSHVV